MAAKRKELDWYTIKYKDIYTVIIAAVLILVVGGGGFFIWKWYFNMESKAERSLSRARKLIDAVDKLDLSPEQKATLTQARSTYSTAESEFKQGKYRDAFNKASDIIETISSVDTGVKDKQKFALLQEVEGLVEVKKSGQHLFSSGKENQPLESGDIVKTGKDGSCRIKYHTGYVNVVNPDTLMVIQISANPGGGFKIAPTLMGGSAEGQTSGTQKESDQSYIVGKNQKVSISPDSRAALVEDKDSGKTRVANLGGISTVEGPQGQRLVLTPGTAVTATAEEIGNPVNLILPPTASMPRDGEIIRLQDAPRQPVTLEWSGGSSSGTLVQVSSKALFTKLLGEQVVKGNKLTLEGLPAGTYFWRLKVPGDETQTFWSKTFKFRILQIYKKTVIQRNLRLHVESTPIGGGIILQGATDPGVSVSVNNLEIPVNADGSFNKIVLFSDAGPQSVVVVRAFDDQGNEKVNTLKFQRSSD